MQYMVSQVYRYSRSRRRRIKCDGVRPVCGRCDKSNRQCLGFEEPNRLILKDETETVIKRLTKQRRRSSGDSSEGSPTSLDSITSTTSPSSVEIGAPAHRHPNLKSDPTLDDLHRAEWFPIRTIQMVPAYEQNQIALHCCRETVSFRTLSWIMSDDKWIELLPKMMERSESLKAVIHANASNYLAKAAGATSTPRQALTHYAFALQELQRDLYDPVRQRSDETLFAIILLAVFDVCPWVI